MAQQPWAAPAAWATAAPGAAQVASYLSPLGYTVLTPEAWALAPKGSPRRPVLKLDLEGREEADGHTAYLVRALLTARRPELQLCWLSSQRLAQLREGLHDAVRTGVGTGYEQLFCGAPFARRGAPAGTSERLQLWLERLAAHLSSGALPPWLVAHCLMVLGTPPPSEGDLSNQSSNNLSGVSGMSLRGPVSPPSQRSPQGTTAPAAAAPAPLTLAAAAAAAAEEPRGPAREVEETAEEARDVATPPIAPVQVDEDCGEWLPDEASLTKGLGPQPWTAFSFSAPTTPDSSAAIMPFLHSFGYHVVDAGSWRFWPNHVPEGPKFRLKVEGHDLVDGHVYYNLSCSLCSRQPEVRLQWTVKRTLAEIQEEVRDVAKRTLRSSYADVFKRAPFASAWAVSGTTARLHKYLGALARGVNEGLVPPVLVAQTLWLLNPPIVDSRLSSPDSAKEGSGSTFVPSSSMSLRPRKQPPLARLSSQERGLGRREGRQGEGGRR